MRTAPSHAAPQAGSAVAKHGASFLLFSDLVPGDNPMVLALSSHETFMVGQLVEIGPWDTQLHEAFYRFVAQAFSDVGFALWAERGGWDDSFTVFALVEDDEIVSTIGRTAMRLVIDGTLVDAYQLASVATRPDRRGQGNLRRLMEHILSLPPLDDRPVILFGNPDVVDFYPRFGFERLAQSSFTLPHLARTNPKPPAVRNLDVAQPDDRALLAALCLRARSTSDDFSARDYYPILLWHLTYRPLAAVRLDAEDAVVVVSQEEGRLVIHDILAQAAFDLTGIIDLVAPGPFDGVEFRFNPENWIGGNAALHDAGLASRNDREAPCFIRGRPRPQNRAIRFPELAQT
jgi:predicted N-acetyltransferase YhbS